MAIFVYLKTLPALLSSIYISFNKEEIGQKAFTWKQIKYYVRKTVVLKLVSVCLCAITSRCDFKTTVTIEI